MGASEQKTGNTPRPRKGKNMKKFVSLLLAAVLLCGAVFAMASCTQKDDALDKAYNKYLEEVKAPTDSSLATLTVATSPDFAPMEFVDLAKKGDAQYVGFDILLANYLAKEMNKKLVIKPMSFDACMAAVQSGNVDLAISGFSWTAERAENFLISDYYVAGENETEQVLITTKAKAGTLKTVSDYAGLKVGAQGGSLQQFLVTEQLVPAGAEMVKMDYLNDLVTALNNGQIDALAVAKGSGDAFIAANAGKLDFAGYKFEINDEKYKNNVILLNKNSTDLLVEVNAALAKAFAADYYTGWYEACQIYSEIKTIDELGYDDDGKKITE